MIGQTISHYKILEKLGEGGMGVVYKAEDTKLKRTVALKFLPSEFTQDAEAKERFIHEAQAASALDHPNICNIHEIGETEDGQMFIAMACYEGDTLKLRIAKGQLRIEEAVDLAIQVGQGLQKAHEKGIVHRDIKPGNIIITNDGVAKILDFGLAKLAGQAKLTKTGSTVGTAAYMSPEQAQGWDVDHGTDIWSLGVVLFEMLTGKLPFGGEHEAALLYSIVHEEPLAISRFRVDVPGGLVSIINKALQKDRTQRYQTMKEMVSELKSAMAPAVELPKQEKSIVVLPFANLSPDPDNGFFADGLTEELIADLSKVQALRVVSRTSAQRYRGTDKSLPQIATELQVRYVMEGSVRRAGNNLRITAQLIDALTDSHLWAEKYNGTYDDIFDMQEKVSRAIVKALEVQLSPQEQRQLGRRDIADAEVYGDWLRVRQLVRRYSTTGLREAVGRLEAGLQRIGDNASVMAGIALVYCHEGMLGRSEEEVFQRAVVWAERALAVNPETAQAHLTLGIVEILWGKPKQALLHLKSALLSEAGDWDTHQWLAYLYNGIGRHKEALVHARALKALDPAETLGDFWIAWTLLYDGREEEAIQSIEGLTVDWDNPHRLFFMAWIQTWLGKKAQALEILEQVKQTASYDYLVQLCLLFRDALRGDSEGFNLHLSTDLIRSITADAWGACTVAEFCCILGDKESALRWLDQAASWGWFNYILYSRTDPFFEPLRNDARYSTFLQRVKKLTEEFEV